MPKINLLFYVLVFVLILMHQSQLNKVTWGYLPFAILLISLQKKVYKLSSW